MERPILYNINAFDATLENIIYFVWYGDQNIGNVCTIYDKVSGELVYQKEQTTMQCKHIIQPNTLQNGKGYIVKIQVVDINHNLSNYSDTVIFYCFTTPQFEFINMKDVVRNSSVNVTIQYFQEQDEPLQSWEISLYDSSKSKIDSSGIMYSNDINYTFTNLEDNRNYYVKATCSTLHEMEVSTDYIQFSVEYIKPSVYSLLSLECIDQEGSIKIQSNIKAIECKTIKEPIYEDGKIVLLDDSLWIDEDFSFNNDYVIKLCGNQFTPNNLIMQLFNGKDSIKLYYRKGTFDVNDGIEKIYFELKIPVVQTTHMIVFSNYLDIPDYYDLLDITVRCKNGFYSIEVQEVEV